MTSVQDATPLCVRSTSITPARDRTGLSITLRTLTGDTPVSNWIIGIITGLALLGLYTWIVINLAAAIAERRIVEKVEQWQDEGNQLDDMLP